MSVMKSANLDYGGLVSRTPERHFEPTSPAEVSRIVKEAARHRRRLVIRGRGHTVNGQSQTTDWLLDTRRLDRIDVPHEGSIWVGAGATWRDVLRHCAQVGKCPPVLTDYLGLSVGGTLSVGGFGPASSSRGLQVDHVLELEVVTSSGQVITCSPSHHGELFDACRAGFGQFAVITRACLRLEEMPNTVTAQECTCQDAGTLLAQLRIFALSCDETYGIATLTRAAGPCCDWQFTATGIRRNFGTDTGAADGSELSWIANYWDYATRLDSEVSESLAERRRWRHPWIDMVLPAARAAEYLEMIQHVVSPRTLGSGIVLVYPVRGGAGLGCFAPLSAKGDHVLIDVLRKLPATDPEALDDALHENVQLLTNALQMNGGLYAISAVDAEPAQWSRAATNFAAITRGQDMEEHSTFVALAERVLNRDRIPAVHDDQAGSRDQADRV